jgi:hypothetical protein
MSGCFIVDFTLRVVLEVNSLSSLSYNVSIKNGTVNCTLVQALRFCTGRTAHRRSRGIALLFLDHGTSRGWGVSVMPRPLFTPGKDPVPIVQGAGWAPGPVCIGVENPAPTGIRPPNCSYCNQSLYRLRYPVHTACPLLLPKQILYRGRYGTSAFRFYHSVVSLTVWRRNYFF